MHSLMWLGSGFLLCFLIMSVRIYKANEEIKQLKWEKKNLQRNQRELFDKF